MVSNFQGINSQLRPPSHLHCIHVLGHLKTERNKQWSVSTLHCIAAFPDLQENITSHSRNLKEKHFATQTEKAQSWKKKTWPTFSIFFSIPVIDEVVASNCVNTSGISVQVGGSETRGCATMCDRPAHLQYYELSQEPRDGHLLKSHILEEKSEIFLLSIYSNHLKK